MAAKIVLLGFMIVLAYQDWQEKIVDIRFLLPAGILGIITQIFDRNQQLPDIMLGAGVGIFVLILAAVSKSIGIGDGLTLVVSGIYLGFAENIELLMTALLLAGSAALFLIIIKKKERRYQMPFIPFLLVGYLFVLL